MFRRPAMQLLLLLLLSILVVRPSTAAEPLLHPGDHVAIVGNTFADQLRREGYLETLLLQRVVDAEGKPALSFRNFGWGGDTLRARDRPTNFPTEDATLTEFATDVILLSFGLSESFAGDAGRVEFRADYERLIDHYLSQQYNGSSPPRLVLLSPIAFEDLGPSTPNAEQRNRDLAAYTKVVGEIARAKDIGFVDLHTPTLEFMSAGDAPRLTVNGVHLTALGYWHVDRLLADALVPGPPGNWRIEIDFQTAAATGKNLAVENAKFVSGGIAFSVTEPAWPAPPPPQPSPSISPDLLILKNLPDATIYTLTIDGIVVATATAEEWANGVPLDASPTHREVESYRSLVNHKNEQFTYSWKALNQVHIVGERKKSNSGRALPAEIVQFNELAIQKDAALRTLPPNDNIRQWRLTATPEK